ncbi:phage tail protein, partial [Streptomyces palmae]|uniref:phage tail protein n=1 Tax=Streptomyces palmae TaxID=1701085 RepID=UPI003CC917AE
VTEEQLKKGNEPAFDQALSEKKKSEEHSAKAPAQARGAEAQQLAAAKSGAAASGAQAMTALTATRAAAGKQIDGGKGQAKSKDEEKRQQVTSKLQKVFDATKKDVEQILAGLDTKVDQQFTAGEKAARDAFMADQSRRIKAYKDKRYSGFTGKLRWVKDKFKGLPAEANQLYQESRKLYVTRMQGVISSIADTIGVELGKAKARIATGRNELKAEVDKLPADLKKFGQEAAKDFAGKFDDLDSQVNEKSQQLVQDLATKYTQALNKIDEEIKKLQEANKGLIDKAKDAIVGVIKTINELKNLLMGILAKAAGAIVKIIKDPIGFLGNLVRAVGAGLQQFITNIADHLKKGLVSWLLGTAVKAGLDLPAKFDLKGIIQLIASLLGLTWANIRARVTRKGVPDQAMSTVESSVPIAQALVREGPAGAVKEISAEVGDLKSTILSKLTTYLIPTVIIAGITWILSLLNPASAFVRAVKGIIDIVTFVVNQGAQIIDFVNAVLDAVVAIAGGGAAGVPKMVEGALAASIPLLIGFLASLLGIGNLAAKVKSVFHAVSRPVNRAIDKIVDFIAKTGKKLWAKLRRKDRNQDSRGGKPSDKKPNGKRPDARDEAKKQADLNAGLDAADALVQRGLTRKEITPKLAAIRKRYGMKELSLVHDGKQGNNELVHVQGKVNPSGKRVTKPIPGLFESIDPNEKGIESFSFKGDTQPGPPRNDAVEITTEVRLMDGKQVKATGHVKNSFGLKTNDVAMKEHFLDAIPANKRWIEAPGVPLAPGKGTPLVTYVNLRQMRRFEEYAGSLAVKEVKAERRRQGMSGTLEPEAERQLRQSRKVYGTIKSVTLDTVENITAILQLHDQLKIKPGIDLNQAILATHSVSYVETIIIQAGGRIKSAEVIGGESRTIGELMRHYEQQASQRRRAEVVAHHEDLLKQYGVSRSEKMLMDFDVRLTIEPFGPA